MNNTRNEDFTLDVYEDKSVTEDQTQAKRKHRLESDISQIRNEIPFDRVYIKEEPESREIVTNICGSDLSHDNANLLINNGTIKTEMLEIEEHPLPPVNIVDTENNTDRPLAVNGIKEEIVDINEDITEIQHDVHFESQLSTSTQNNQIGVRVDFSTNSSSFQIDISHSNTSSMNNREGSLHDTQNVSNFSQPYDRGKSYGGANYPEGHTFQHQEIQRLRVPDRPLNRTLVTIKLDNNLFKKTITQNKEAPSVEKIVETEALPVNEASNTVASSNQNAMLSDRQANSTSSSENTLAPSNQNAMNDLSSDRQANSTSSSESSEDSDDEPPRPVKKGLNRKEPVLVQSENTNINDVVKKLLFSENNSTEEEQLGQKLMDLLNEDDSEGEADHCKKTPKRTSPTSCTNSSKPSTENNRGSLVKKTDGKRLKRTSFTEKQQSCRNASKSSQKKTPGLGGPEGRSKKRTTSTSPKVSSKGSAVSLAVVTSETHLGKSNIAESTTSDDRTSADNSVNRLRKDSDSSAVVQERLVNYLNKNIESLITTISAFSDKEASESSDTDNENINNVLTEKNSSPTSQTITRTTSLNKNLTDGIQTPQNRFNDDCQKITSSLDSVSKKLDMLKQTVSIDSTISKNDQSKINQSEQLSVSCKTNVSYRTTTGNKRSSSVDQSQNQVPPPKKAHTETQLSTTTVSEISTNVVECSQTQATMESSDIMSEQELNETYHTVNDFLKGMLNPNEDPTNLPTFLGQVYFKGYESGLQDKFCVQGSRGRGRRGGGGRKTI